jgi:hypothetical protein
MDFPHGVMVTLRSTTTGDDDGLGNTTDTVTETAWGPCAVAPRYARESTDPQVPPVIVGKVVYGPPVDIDSDDTLVIDGVAYQVDGLPGEWTNPFTGWQPGIEVPVKRAAGV